MRFIANIPITVKALTVVAIPLAMLTLWMINDLQQAHKNELSMQTMLQAADLSAVASSLVTEVQKERGMSAGFLGSRGKHFSKSLTQQYKPTDQTFANLKASIERNSLLMNALPDLHGIFEHFVEDMAQLEAVRQSVHQLDSQETADQLTYYIDMVDDLIQASNNIRMIYTFGANSSHEQDSNNMIVPDARFSGLMSSFILLGRAEEAAGMERALLSYTFSQGQFETGKYEHFVSLVSLQRQILNEFSLQNPEYIEHIFASTYTDQAAPELEKFRIIAVNKASQGDFGVNSEQWFLISSQRIALLHQVKDEIVELIKQHSLQGVAKAARHIQDVLMKGMAVLLIAGGLSLWATWLLLLGIRRASQAVQSIEAGEYEVPVVVKGSDEMGRMLGGVERMRLSLMATEQARAEQEKKAHSRLEELMRARDELHKEHSLIERLLTAMPSILIAVDKSGNISLWNHVAEKVFGLAREEVTGSMFSSLSIQWDWDELNRALAESEALFTSSLDHLKFKRSDASDGFLGLTISAVMDAGQHNGFLLIGADKTKRMQLENQLQMSQKMESMGELAAGIAHEINTPMQYIGDNVRFLKDGFGDMLQLVSSYHQTIEEINQGKLNSEQKVNEVIQQAEEDADIEFLREEVPLAVGQTLEGIEHVSKIVGAMKELSHPGTGDKSPIDINKVIENTVTVSRNEWKYVAELEMNLDSELPMIHGLPEINQVFLNIIVNAAHAIEEQLQNSSEELGKIQIQSSFSNDSVEIRISDSGSGIAKDKVSKIFDPFFTTKAPGKGTGQGLAISHQIVCNRLGGQLSVESEPGHGTCFIIKLPIAEKEL